MAMTPRPTRPGLLFARVELKARLGLMGVRRSAARQARELRSLGHPHAERLARALERIAADHLTAEARAGLARAEAARRALLSSTDVVRWADGATESVASICARASQPPSGARLLHHVVSVWEPRQALELGTCVGISAAYQALAMQDTGTLTSLEAYPDLALRAEET